MKLKVVSGYFFDGPTVYHTGEVFEWPDEKAELLVSRARGDIAYVADTPVPAAKTKSTRKTAKKAKLAAVQDDEEQEMSLPDVDAASAISK